MSSASPWLRPGGRQKQPITVPYVMGQIGKERKVSLGRCEPMSAQQASHLARHHIFGFLLVSCQKTTIDMDDTFFLLLSARILDRDENPDGHGAETHFRRFFGASPLTVALTWELLGHHGLLPANAHPVHLLWACGFVRQYLRVPVLVALYEATEKTICRRMWPVIMGMAALTSIVVRCRRRRCFVVRGRRPSLLLLLSLSYLFLHYSQFSFYSSHYKG